MNLPPTLPPKPQEPREAQVVQSPKPLQRSISLLPRAKLEEFASSHALLLGYLAHQDDFKDHQKEVVAVLESQKQRLKTLANEFNELNQPNGIKYTINNKLQELEHLANQFRKVESQMFQKLSGTQVRYKDVLAQKLEVGIREQDKISKSLLESVDGDDQVSSFVDEYKKSQAKLHYRTETMKRLQEDRIGGVI